MPPEQKSEKSIHESLLIKQGVEIKVGQIVPILEHSQCPGRFGTIVQINLKYDSYKAKCNSNNCGRDVIVDIKSL